LRWRLLGNGVTIIVPYRQNRTDSRRLHYRHRLRLRHRWKIERTNACLIATAA
jgi:hypothetical protein